MTAASNGTDFSDWIFSETVGELWTYEYDLQNRMTKANYSGKGNSNLKERGSYVYDYRGLLVKKTYQNYNPSDLVEVENEEAAKQVTEFYEYTAGGRVIYNESTEENTIKKTTYIWANKTLWCEVNAGVVYYHHTDHLGTTEVITNENGTVVWEAGYEAFGSVLNESGESKFTPSYTGKFFDKASGLYYFNARWYDSELGKFTSQDPARDGGNWWVYCGNNPLSNVDTNGLYQHQIKDKYKMNQKNSPWVTNNETINGTDLLVSRSGCAITCVANLLSDTTNFTPSDINNKYVTSDGKVDWEKAGKDNGYSVDVHENENFTRETMFKQMADQHNTYKTVVKVKYNDGGDDHWVGVAGMTSLDGKDYLIIAGSSVNDSYLGNGLSWNKETEKYDYTDTNNRQGKGWKVVNGQILVPVENTTKYINFTKPAPEGNEQNLSGGNDIKDF